MILIVLSPKPRCRPSCRSRPRGKMKTRKNKAKIANKNAPVNF